MLVQGMSAVSNGRRRHANNLTADSISHNKLQLKKHTNIRQDENQTKFSNFLTKSSF